jgi:hypothetical protein
VHFFNLLKLNLCGYKHNIYWSDSVVVFCLSFLLLKELN